MFFPIPMQMTDGTRRRELPSANGVLILVNVVAYLLLSPESWWVGPGTGLLSLMTYGFVHASFTHLLFNMWFLWVFGNAVNRRIGNGYYLLSYFAAILLVGLIGRLLAGGYLLGASGGVYGVMGIALLLLPSASVEVHYLMVFPLTLLWGLFRRPEYPLFWFLRWGAFQVTALFAIVFYVLGEISLILLYGLNWTNLGHLLGFCAGIGAVLLMPVSLTMGSRANTT